MQGLRTLWLVASFCFSSAAIGQTAQILNFYSASSGPVAASTAGRGFQLNAPGAPLLRPEQRSGLYPSCRWAPSVQPRALDLRAATQRQSMLAFIQDAECAAGLPAGLMDSVVLAESRYDPGVTSSAGAVGLAQLMPATAIAYGAADRTDPDANVHAGARYLKALIDTFGGSAPLALAAYNAGPAAVRRARGIPRNGETPSYVDRVMRDWRATNDFPVMPAATAHELAEMLGFAPKPSLAPVR